MMRMPPTLCYGYHTAAGWTWDLKARFPTLDDTNKLGSTIITGATATAPIAADVDFIAVLFDREVAVSSVSYTTPPP
jgi:hypothetical protein